MELSVKYFYAVMGWVLWCTFHSTLISITVTEYIKRKLGDGFRFYRLFYNAASVATLIPLIYYSHMILEVPVFSWEGPLAMAKSEDRSGSNQKVSQIRPGNFKTR